MSRHSKISGIYYKKNQQMHINNVCRLENLKEICRFLKIMSTKEIQMTDISIRIIIWNANGLALRSKELEIFLKQNNIAIALISETHLTSKSHLKMFRFKAYHTTHSNSKAHTGSAIIIKNNIKHKAINH